MNDLDLDLALERLVTEHKRTPAPAALYERVWAIPATTPRVPRQAPWSGRGRVATLFRATGLLAGAMIVALAGGLLFSAAQPSPVPDVVVPTATTPASPRATIASSPSPAVTGAPTDASQAVVRDDLLPGVELEVAQVGPGAYRVLGDGLHVLTPLDHEWVASGRDGSIWLYSADGAFRLGRDIGLERPITAPWFRVAPDGTVWIIGTEPDTDRTVVSAYDGDAWSVHPLPSDAEPTDLDVGADGTVWVAWQEPGQDEGSRIAAYRDESGWQVVDGTAQVGSLVVTDAGDLWSQDYGVHVYGASEGLDRVPDELRVGRTGTVWAIDYADEGSRALTRWRGGAWEECPLDAAPEGFLPALGLAVSPDGSVWGRYTARSEGAVPSASLAGFDCRSWIFPLPGQDVSSSPQPVGIADDGSIWVVTRPERSTQGPASEDAWEPHLYVITPDASDSGDTASDAPADP